MNMKDFERSKQIVYEIQKYERYLEIKKYLNMRKNGFPIIIEIGREGKRSSDLVRMRHNNNVDTDFIEIRDKDIAIETIDFMLSLIENKIKKLQKEFDEL